MALPAWITNIFTGLGSIGIASYAGSIRLLQVLLSIVLLGLSGSLVQSNDSSLASLAGSVDSLLGTSNATAALFNATGSANSSSVVLQSLKSTSILGPATSMFTSVSHTSMSLMPYALSREANTMVSSTDLDSLSGVFGLSNGEFSYASGVSGSEMASMALWFASAIYATANYGSWDCSDPVKLLGQYNQSGVDSNSLSLFNEILSYNGDDLDTDDTDNTTLSLIDNWQQIYDIFNSTITISGANLTSITAKQQLMIELSQDCSKKKATIGVCWLGVLTFVFSSGLVAVSANRLSNGTTVGSTTTTTSSSSTGTASSSSTDFTSIELLSVKADTSGGIPMSRDHQRILRNMQSFFVSHVQIENSIDSTGSRYICQFLLRNNNLDQAISTKLTVGYLDHPSQISIIANTSSVPPSSVSSTSDSVEFDIQEIVGIYSIAGDTSDEKFNAELNSLEKLVVFLTLNSFDVRVCFDVMPLKEPFICKAKADPEAKTPPKKYRMKYSRAILFPMPIEA